MSELPTSRRTSFVKEEEGSVMGLIDAPLCGAKMGLHDAPLCGAKRSMMHSRLPIAYGCNFGQVNANLPMPSRPVWKRAPAPADARFGPAGLSWMLAVRHDLLSSLAHVFARAQHAPKT